MNADFLMQRALGAENLGDLFKVVMDIAEYLQGRERELEDIITNLDSDNIAEIDFSRTRAKNTQKLTKDIDERLKKLESELNGGGN